MPNTQEEYISFSGFSSKYHLLYDRIGNYKLFLSCENIILDIHVPPTGDFGKYSALKGLQTEGSG